MVSGCWQGGSLTLLSLSSSEGAATAVFVQQFLFGFVSSGFLDLLLRLQIEGTCVLWT